MLNARLWIRNPYPFRFEETRAIEESLRKTYGVKATYFKEWPVDYVDMESVTMATCKHVAATLKCIHLQWAIRDRRSGSRVNAEEVEVEILGQRDRRPDWATDEKG